MKAAVFTIIVLAVSVGQAIAQRIDTETGDRTRIVHLKTALNHLTVIEVAEPVVEVAAGSPAFKVEWRENKVFVQPTEADAATNLFIWTATQRFNYELEPAGEVNAMDFAIDQAPVHLPEAPKPAAMAAPAPPSITDLLLASKPVRMQPTKQRNQPLEVQISDLYEKDGRVLIRYAVRNRTDQPYSLGAPQVYQLDGVRFPQSLYGMNATQLANEQAAKLKIKQQLPVPVVEGPTQPSLIAPGQEAVGVVIVEMPASVQPTVLRLQFDGLRQAKDDTAHPQQNTITAFLVR